MNKSLYLVAALLLASTSAYAGNGVSFEVGGQRIHIDAPRNCSSLNCVSISNNGSPINLKNLNLKGKNSDDDDAATNSPHPAPLAPSAPAPVASNPPPAQPAPAPVTSNAPPLPPASTPDASHERLTGLPATNDRPVRAATPVAPRPIASNTQSAPIAAPTAQPIAQQPTPTTPLGLWQTADNKGNVRIEQCGANLCGYAEHTNERILINMKPSSDNKWTGRIHDPDSGSNYDSTIAMKGPNLLKVQGCAFGGLFCGGQTWKRMS